ncbi:MAG TPA: metallophosphoesterase [Actinomycetospora sp.]|jgi:3',5'-cyclic AMP phosphodiesterase CpdA|uniref:metallophosphoesterase n=1 Tax=Actinomycetospora sp. TaxID=1872135 RepID=UPI002F40F6A6
MLIAHLSDLHLDTSRRSGERAERVIDHVRALSPRPDLVLVTGDVADHGAPEEYDQAAALLAGLDAHLVPGNHDRRPTMRAALGLRGDGPITRRIEVGRTVVVLADSHVPGHDHGKLAPESVALIEDAAAERRPLVVALHHPPMAIGSGLIDPIRLLDPEPLLAPLRAHEAPRVVLCGHAHTALGADVGGVPVRIAPGVASTLRLPYEPEPDSLDGQAPPGLALHHLDEGSGELHTHVRALTASPGP